MQYTRPEASCFEHVCPCPETSSGPYVRMISKAWALVSSLSMKCLLTGVALIPGAWCSHVAESKGHEAWGLDCRPEG